MVKTTNPSGNQLEDVGAYLPSPEKIAEECRKLREKHLRKLRESTRYPSKHYYKEPVSFQGNGRGINAT